MDSSISKFDANATHPGTGGARRKPPAREGELSCASVLSVSPVAADHDELQQVLRADRCIVHTARTLSTAQSILLKERPPVVICECDLGQASWREMVTQIAQGGVATSLIVTSRFADERLWVEALNGGAFDVLVKPLNAAELKRVLNAAWYDCRGRAQGGRTAERIRMARAAH